MEGWLLSINCLPSEHDRIWRTISHEILEMNGRPKGEATRVNIPMDFKSGSLDALVSTADEMSKLDKYLEAVIRRVER